MVKRKNFGALCFRKRCCKESFINGESTSFFLRSMLTVYRGTRAFLLFYVGLLSHYGKRSFREYISRYSRKKVD